MCDCEQPKIYQETIRKAVKTHYCRECGNGILPKLFTAEHLTKETNPFVSNDSNLEIINGRIRVKECQNG